MERLAGNLKSLRRRQRGSDIGVDSEASGSAGEAGVLLTPWAARMEGARWDESRPVSLAPTSLT